ncbi:MAG: hypothetical protein U0Q21_11235 [Dermatophilaceae bacterium]
MLHTPRRQGHRSRGADAAYSARTDGLDRITCAPFQIRAGQGAAYALTQQHPWHGDRLGRLDDPIRTARRHRVRRGRPLWKVHQAVLAVLALESEPVAPRL